MDALLLFEGGEGEAVAFGLAKFRGARSVSGGECLPAQPLSREGGTGPYLSPDREDLRGHVLQGSLSCECS